MHSNKDDSYIISKRIGSAHDEVSVDKNILMWLKEHTAKIKKTCANQFASRYFLIASIKLINACSVECLDRKPDCVVFINLCLQRKGINSVINRFF